MSKLKNTPYYHEAFNELNYSFGTYYLFETFIVAEINEDVVYNWEEHGKMVSKDISNLYENDGKDLVYLTNRINPYAVQPSDWINFYKNSFNLKGYGIINYTKTSYFNNILEKIFISANFRSFTSLEEAIYWAKSTTDMRSSKAS